MMEDCDSESLSLGRGIVAVSFDDSSVVDDGMAVLWRYGTAYYRPEVAVHAVICTHTFGHKLAVPLVLGNF